MATLKMGSTTMLTESSGALTINASNPTVTLGSNTTFPAGHMRHLASSPPQSVQNNSTGGPYDILSNLSTGTFTAGSKIWLIGHGTSYYGAGNSQHYGYMHFSGKAASTGTASDSGIGNNDPGQRILQEVAYTFTGTGHAQCAGASLITPTNGATTASYNIVFTQTGTKQFYHYSYRLHLFEVFV